ncbi:MAG: DUF1573 domain-containing protein [Gemmataceae bacterium]
MKALTLLSALLGTVSVASFVYALKFQPETTPPPPAVERLGVHVLEPDKHFGVVGLHQQLHGSFVIVNDTDTSITLGELMRSCSCTAATLERRELGPGERCSLTIEIHTGNRRGPRVETVGVVCSASGSSSPQQILTKSRFEVKGIFEIEPGGVTLTRAEPKASFTIRAASSAEQAKVLDVRSSHRCVKVDTRELPIVTLELDLETPDESILNTECVVYTNNPAEETITVPVRVRK